MSTQRLDRVDRLDTDCCRSVLSVARLRARAGLPPCAIASVSRGLTSGAPRGSSQVRILISTNIFAQYQISLLRLPRVIMSTFYPFSAAIVVHSRARARLPLRTHPLSSASCDTGAMRWLLPVVAAVMTMSAGFGVARAQGTWSTAQLSVPRYALAATSSSTILSPSIAIFAGGVYAGDFVVLGGVPQS